MPQHTVPGRTRLTRPQGEILKHHLPPLYLKTFEIIANQFSLAKNPPIRVSFLSSTASSFPVLPEDSSAKFSELLLSDLLKSSLPRDSSSSKIISASPTLSKQRLGCGLSQDIGYDLCIIVNNLPLTKKTQETPAATPASPTDLAETFGSFGKFPR